MKKKLKVVLRRILMPLVFKLGFIDSSERASNNESVNSTKLTLLDNLYRNLIITGLRVNHIVDIGANHGYWTREALKHFPDASYSLIEPQDHLKVFVEDLVTSNPKIKWYNMGMGKEKGEFDFTIVDRDDSCSFRYSKEEADSLGFKQIKIPVNTLADLVMEESLPIPELVKIDAEGLDLDVLRGCKGLLGKTEVFLVEAAVVSKNFDNNVQTVVSFMADNGYRLFDITDLNRPWNLKVLWLVELAFVKIDGIIDSYKFKGDKD